MERLQLTEDEQREMMAILRRLRETPFGRITINLKNGRMLDMITERREKLCEVLTDTAA